MNNNQLQNIIKKIIGNISYKKIILFGSRARGNFSKESDYDILIIAKESLAIKEKMRLSGLIRRELAKVGIDSDIIIKSQEEADYYKDKIGSVVKNALAEGIAL